mgnify:FL=1
MEKSNEYSLVLLGLIFILLTYVFTMYKFAMGARIQVFTGKQMKKFKEIHQKEIKEDMAP